MSESVDVAVLGGGIVGLAIARALARTGRFVVVLERHDFPCFETSSRNSGVIHSGIYYPTGSLKATLCVRGRHLLYEFLEERNLSHARCGKIIVAQTGEVEALHALARQGVQNGVRDLELLNEAEVRRLEPEVHCAEGLWCPSTGIVDVHELAHALIGDLEAEGGAIVYRTRVDAARPGKDGWKLFGQSGSQPMDLQCGLLVNSAGLEAVPMLRRIEGYPAELLRTDWYAKGNYFALSGCRPFRHLVYPMPDRAGLGIHATLGLDGSTRFGPNVEWIPSPGYEVDDRHLEEFESSIRRYWPGLDAGRLRPDYAGVRPKLVGPGSKPADFIIEGPDLHRCPGLINLLGIESPGLTSCLAIGELVARRFAA